MPSTAIVTQYTQHTHITSHKAALASQNLEVDVSCASRGTYLCLASSALSADETDLRSLVSPQSSKSFHGNEIDVRAISLSLVEELFLNLLAIDWEHLKRVDGHEDVSDKRLQAV